MSSAKRAKVTINNGPSEPIPDALRALDAQTAATSPHPIDRHLAEATQSTRASVPPGKGTTVHLTKAAAKELKKLAADRETTVHALMIEGINLVFKQYGIAHTAEAGARPKAVDKLASKKAN